jgi:hypothetical protein
VRPASLADANPSMAIDAPYECRVVQPGTVLPMLKWRNVLVMTVVGVLVTACAGSEGPQVAPASAVATTAGAAPTEPPTTPSPPRTTETPDTETPDTETPSIAVSFVDQWERIVGPAECMCSDKSEYSYFVRKADPAKVVFVLEGGGACFDAVGCGPRSTNFKRTAGYENGVTLAEGLFDLDNLRNPFADYSMVFVPYCTGDVHIGNTTHDYGDGVVVEHKGFVNASTALKTMAETFPDATEVVVTGASAGSVPTPLYAGLTRDLLPAARISVFADGSGAYPDIPGINGLVGSVWGTMNAVPEWPVNVGITAETWSFPGLFVKAGTYAPDIAFARHDYAFDETQVFFAGLGGIATDDLVSLIDRNEAQIEAAGVELDSYISPGHDHTVIGKPEFYTETVNGVLLVDWVRDLIAGKPIDDVHCEDCGS